MSLEGQVFNYIGQWTLCPLKVVYNTYLYKHVLKIQSKSSTMFFGLDSRRQ